MMLWVNKAPVDKKKWIFKRRWHRSGSVENESSESSPKDQTNVDSPKEKPEKLLFVILSRPAMHTYNNYLTIIAEF